METMKLILDDSYSTAEIHAALTMNLWNVHDAIDSLLDAQVSKKAKSYTGSPNSANFLLEDIMYDHSKRVLTHKWHQLEVDRSNLWRQACVLYKNSFRSPQCLADNVVSQLYWRGGD